MDDEKSRMAAIQKTSTKMAVGLAAAVVAAGTVEVCLTWLFLIAFLVNQLP